MGKLETLDTSDVDLYVGQEVAGGRLKEPITVTDIRRWAQAMDYPNARHFEEAAAARTLEGVIVAPQSFTASCDVGHGSIPAIVGCIPGSHVVFGGDEWWFYGPRIRPGDKIDVRRRFDGYTLADTKFAGPTMFSRGDTLYLNQRKDPVAKQRSTMARYRPEFARARGFYDQSSEAPAFTADQLREFVALKRAWIRSGASGEGPGEVRPGDRLPRRVIGPHTITGFAAEFSALLFGVWGSSLYDADYRGLETGWLPELMGGDDPAMGIGMNEGPASSHTNPDKGKLIGMPRNYGYGVSTGVWALDYLAYWAGDAGFVRHAKIDYRFPVFEGNVTFVDGEVTSAGFDPLLGVQMASVDVSLTNQDGVVVAKGRADVELRRL